MKLTRKDPDLNLILESLQEVGIIVEPIKIKGHTCMTDENGNEMYVDKNFNIFDDFVSNISTNEMFYCLINNSTNKESNSERYIHSKLNTELLGCGTYDNVA